MHRSVRLLTIVLAASVLLSALAGIAAADTVSTYATWTTAAPNAGTLLIPHKDYRLYTVKCAVCHAVHKSEPTGEVLLRSTVQEACVYCHIQTNLGGRVIYAGDASLYYNSQGFGHDIGESDAAQCVNCHSVHGANTMEGVLSASILRVRPYESRLVTDTMIWKCRSAPLPTICGKMVASQHSRPPIVRAAPDKACLTASSKPLRDRATTSTG